METNKQIIQLTLIDEPTLAMRTDIDRDAVFELAADIQKNGLINPITVRPKGERFEVVAGHRRFLAHRFAGIPMIDCVVRELTEDEAFAIMTSENLKRENVNPVDEAVHTERLMKMHNNDTRKVADIVGRSTAWVEDRMQIAVMDEDYKQALRQEKIKLGVALALSEISSDTDRRACLEMAISQGASVVVAQYWLAQWRAGLFGTATETMVPDSDVPGGGRTVVMLRCAIDGKQYPATSMTSILICRDNLGFIDAMRQHLESSAPAPELPQGENKIEPQEE